MRISSFLLSILLVGTPVFIVNAEVLTVDPHYTLSVNGTDEVQRIFGGVVNGSTRDEGIDYIRALNLNSARAFMWGPKPPGKDFKTPWYTAQYGGKPISREESFARWDEFYTKGNFPELMEEWWQKGFPRNPQIYQTELFRKWELTRGIVLHTELDGSADRHPEAVNSYYKAYLDTVKRHCPWLNVDFVQFQNEPNYSHWSGQFATDREASEVFIRCFNRLDEFFEKEGIQTRLLGPCLASSAFCSWSGWRSWTVPVLQNLRHVDYFNYQLYGKGAGENLAWLSMLQATGEALRGVRPRGVITETNLTPGDIAPSQTFRWESEQLFTALANPDKLALRTFFLLAYPKDLKNRVDTRGIKILNMADGELKPSAVYWVYWVLSETRGKMLWISPSIDPSLKAIASTPGADRLVISLFNSGNESTTVTLRPGTDIPVKKVVLRHAHMDGEVVEKGENEIAPNKSGEVNVTLPPGGISSVRWSFSGEVKQPARKLEQKEYFAKETAVVLRPGSRIPVSVSGPVSGNDMAFLRLGVTTDDVLMARELALTFNGEPLTINWAAQPQYVLSRFGGFPNTWWVEIPLRPGLVRAQNEILFPEPDASYRLMFASVNLQRFPSDTAARDWFGKRVNRAGSSITAGLRVSGQLYAGDKSPMEFTVRNESNKPFVGCARWALPQGVTMENEDQFSRIALAAGEQKKIASSLRVAAVPEIREEILKVSLETDGQGTPRTLAQNMRLYPNLTAILVNKAPAAGYEGLEGLPVVSTWRQGSVSASTRLGWDNDNLYVMLTVEGGGSPIAPDALESFWKADSLEIFVDLDDAKKQSYDHDDFQLFFCPVGPAGDTAVGGRIAREIRDDSIGYLGARLEPRFQIVRLPVNGADGYSLACSIPWKALNPHFTPRNGMAIGFNVALNHHGEKTSGGIHSSIVGAKGKFPDRPDQWGVLRLGK